MEVPTQDNPRSSPQQKAAATKQRNTTNAFVAAGAEIFRVEGYQVAQVKDIAARAGRSTATFYEVVQRKSRLGLLAVDAAYAGLMDAEPLPHPGVTSSLAGEVARLRRVFELFPRIEQSVADERADAHGDILHDLHHVGAAFLAAVDLDRAAGLVERGAVAEQVGVTAIVVTAAITTLNDPVTGDHLVRAYLESL